MKPQAGDLVKSKIHNYIGMVFITYSSLYDVQWATNIDLDHWFAEQKPQLHPALKKKGWVEVLLMQADTSVLLPADTVEVLVPFRRIKRFLLEIAEDAQKK